MVEALIIIGWRNDIGAYLFDSYPKGVEIDGQDLLNLYNLHRFRDTQANFQFIQTSDLRIASFYSGGYDKPFVGKANYCVAVVLNAGENPDDFEKPLRILCNNLLIKLQDADFDYQMQKAFELLEQHRFSEIKIERKAVETTVAPKPIETTTTIGQKIKEKATTKKDIFDDLLATVSTEEVPDDLKFDEKAFRESMKKTAADDPFGGSGKKVEDEVFGGASSGEDIFAGAQPFEKFEKAQEAATPKAEPKAAKLVTSALLDELKSWQSKIPTEPSEKTPEKMMSFLETKVGVFEKMISIMSKIANQLQAKEKELDDKNELIAKLLLILS